MRSPVEDTAVLTSSRFWVRVPVLFFSFSILPRPAAAARGLMGATALKGSFRRRRPNTTEKQKILKIIHDIVNHSVLKKYYSQNVQIFNEREILTDENTVVIPDRLVIENNKVTIIDYKTGKPDEKHHKQLEKYANALENLGYSIDNKILVYISEELLVQQA